MTFLTWPNKDPDEILDYHVDWSDRLVSGDVIISSTWIVPDGIVVDSDDFSTTLTTIWLSGGTLGGKYSLVNRVATVDGRTMDQTVIIRVKTK